MDGTIMHAVERIYPYCAQQAGYYSALLMTTEHSSIELGNLEFYAQTYAHVCFENGIANRYIAVRDTLDKRLESNSVIQNSIRFKQKVKEKLTLWASQ